MWDTFRHTSKTLAGNKLHDDTIKELPVPLPSSLLFSSIDKWFLPLGMQCTHLNICVELQEQQPTIILIKIHNHQDALNYKMEY